MDRPGCAVLVHRALGGGYHMTERREHGLAIYARILDVNHDEVAETFAARVGPVFAREALEAAGGDAWSNPALTGRERNLAIITALTAQGMSGDRLSTHLQLARAEGLDEAACTALMTLLADYLGYPRASLAMEAIHGWFRSMGATPGPDPSA